MTSFILIPGKFLRNFLDCDSRKHAVRNEPVQTDVDDGVVAGTGQPDQIVNVVGPATRVQQGRDEEADQGEDDRGADYGRLQQDFELLLLLVCNLLRHNLCHLLWEIMIKCANKHQLVGCCMFKIL